MRAVWSELLARLRSGSFCKLEFLLSRRGLFLFTSADRGGILISPVWDKAPEIILSISSEGTFQPWGSWKQQENKLWRSAAWGERTAESMIDHVEKLCCEKLCPSVL